MPLPRGGPPALGLPAPAGRVLRVDRVGLLVERDGRLGQTRSATAGGHPTIGDTVWLMQSTPSPAGTGTPLQVSVALAGWPCLDWPDRARSEMEHHLLWVGLAIPTWLGA